MATVKRVRFLADYYEAGVVKYRRGVRRPQDYQSWNGDQFHYPLTRETESQVLNANAILEDIEMDIAQHARELKAAVASDDAMNARTIAADPRKWREWP